MYLAQKVCFKSAIFSTRTILTFRLLLGRIELPRDKTVIKLGPERVLFSLVAWKNSQTAKRGKEMGKERKYSKDLPRRMYTFFSTYSGTTGAPSFMKFALSIGVTLEELCSYRKNKKFDRSYRECCEIRKDYLIDMALNKRFDSSFTKFLLGECEKGEDEKNGEFKISLEVLEK